MKIERILNYEIAYKSKFGVIDFTINTLAIRDEPYTWESLWYKNNEIISLKDVEYTIIDGVLYLRGTRIWFYGLHEVTDQIQIFGPRRLYVIRESRNNELEKPLTDIDIYIKRWWRKDKKLKGFELKNDEKIGREQLKLKREAYFEFAMSNFILQEKYTETKL